jgi:hypothetical protein
MSVLLMLCVLGTVVVALATYAHYAASRIR